MTHHAVQTVKISDATKLEDVMNAMTTSMVIIVIYPVTVIALVHAIEMESVVHVPLVCMDMIAAKTVQRTVQDHVSNKLENASAAKPGCMVINASLHAQRTVEVNVIKTLDTVQVVKLDTMALGVNQHVLSHVMGVAVKTLDIATATLDTGGINVKIYVQVAV